MHIETTKSDEGRITVEVLGLSQPSLGNFV